MILLRHKVSWLKYVWCYKVVTNVCVHFYTLKLFYAYIIIANIWCMLSGNYPDSNIHTSPWNQKRVTNVLWLLFILLYFISLHILIIITAHYFYSIQADQFKHIACLITLVSKTKRNKYLFQALYIVWLDLLRWQQNTVHVTNIIDRLLKCGWYFWILLLYLIKHEEVFQFF